MTLFELFTLWKNSALMLLKHMKLTLETLNTFWVRCLTWLQPAWYFIETLHTKQVQSDSSEGILILATPKYEVMQRQVQSSNWSQHFVSVSFGWSKCLVRVRARAEVTAAPLRPLYKAEYLWQCRRIKSGYTQLWAHPVCVCVCAMVAFVWPQRLLSGWGKRQRKVSTYAQTTSDEPVWIIQHTPKVQSRFLAS